MVSRDLKLNTCDTKQFDAIFICNGHYTSKYIPHFDGLDKFMGRKMHSHDYRRPDQLKNETVLVIGAGPSGKDITFEITTTAKQVFWSNHSSLRIFVTRSNLKRVEDVKRFNANSVELISGDVVEISCVLFCTGYKHSFPFLSVDCGLSLEDRLHVGPLYKEMINVNHPTMAIIGLSQCILTFLRHDLQVYDNPSSKYLNRKEFFCNFLKALFCLKYWSGEIEPPTKEKMLEELRIENENRLERGIGSRQCHLMITEAVSMPHFTKMNELYCVDVYVAQVNYFNELQRICGMDMVPKVFYDIYLDLLKLNVQHPNSYREFNYTIVDNETFTRKHMSI